MPFEPGHKGGPGRPKGHSNKITEEIREQFANLLENKLPDIERWIQQTAQEDPAKAVDLLIKISERFVPKLSQNQLTGAEGKDLSIEFKFGQRTKPEDEETA